MASAIAKRIGDVVARGLGPALRADGYKKTGATFRRADADVVRVVNVQSSSSNHGDEGRFTLNLGVYVPAAAALLQPIGIIRAEAAPKEYHCPLRERIGMLLPERRDHWWSVSPATDLDALARDVVAAYTAHGRPWLDRSASLEATLEALRGVGGLSGLVAAAIALVLRRRDDAAGIVASVIAHSSRSATGLLAAAERFRAQHRL